MIFHLSIPTSDPERVARVIAEIWGGEAFPFFPHRNESWVAFANDGRGTSVECYPSDAKIAPSEEEKPTGFKILRGEESAGWSTTHAAVSTSLDQGAIVSIGKREDWLVRYAQRGLFGVVELWLENNILLEVLTPELQARYLETQTVENWRRAVAAIEAGGSGWGPPPPT